ncbi:MAG: hypothetical protein LVQ95_01035 [Candidatus Micrarchaeales archaeon]|nr:hypothetical protein [Candidatus Micrarchaeales archaeon]
MVYIPSDVTNSLSLKEGDDVDFFKFDDKSFLLAKKSDVLKMLTHSFPQPAAQTQQQQRGSDQPISISDEELAVLRKLDTIKYNDRTAEKLKQILNGSERKILKDLIAKKFVNPFKKAGEQKSRYGIAKSVYDQFLFGKRQQAKQQPAPPPPVAQAVPKAWEKKLAENATHMQLLEAAGFLVIANQAEASEVSAELEESIRRGLVVGTRAFNKKYYITLKSFVNKNAAKVVKAIGPKGTSVPEISKATGIDEEGVRAILYMLAESGEVSEARRDLFKLV